MDKQSIEKVRAALAAAEHLLDYHLMLAVLSNKIKDAEHTASTITKLKEAREIVWLPVE